MVFSLFKKKKEQQQLKNRVEFCITNLSLGAADAYDELVERDDIEIEESGCTSHCEICEQSIFALVNGEVVTAEDAETLVQAIDEELKQNPLF
ncbi:MAG TPA: DUF1450 domain-containing protein [Lysinibacillus sp.]|jgi:uncharacterized protein YuzB (UPF0349 family)|uniref:DUF1450 domain-containing protein n=1 Tax=Lysinibacillus fusiformis TaxID=28031 RepID=A0A2I0V0K5_9BACI|nr:MULTISPECIES: DUF1450 domain-containing protein [Lysinibacillus]HBT73174.1 DUF1450 domain-containing protein [Lysinibacillus sp.]MEE3806175.1 DUF1450 domain-containing protein [Lysinibacillus fusiformis]PKU51799.1 DUF1450 domain-containing protein [Lysinibacillus fusiformis]WCH46081.1 DUF1450 domain-containing protein [Lysinibacillus sp. OF-1]SCZ07228.1 Uncharacterized protein YuzB, UPF0349 family [Lysinibacillus sp. SG9]